MVGETQHSSKHATATATVTASTNIDTTTTTTTSNNNNNNNNHNNNTTTTTSNNNNNNHNNNNNNHNNNNNNNNNTSSLLQSTNLRDRILPAFQLCLLLEVAVMHRPVAWNAVDQMLLSRQNAIRDIFEHLFLWYAACNITTYKVHTVCWASCRHQDRGWTLLHMEHGHGMCSVLLFPAPTAQPLDLWRSMTYTGWTTLTVHGVSSTNMWNKSVAWSARAIMTYCCILMRRVSRASSWSSSCVKRKELQGGWTVEV